MQNVKEVLTVPRIGTEKASPDHQGAQSPPGGDAVKKIRVSQPREVECRVTRVTSDRDRSQRGLEPGDKLLQTSVIADKYQLFEQEEGSSLHRCVDINTKEELVCKVRGDVLLGVSAMRGMRREST